MRLTLEDYQERFVEMSEEERMELDRFADVRKEYHRDLYTWSSEDLYFGLWGGGEDIQNALENVMKSKTEFETIKWIREFNACEKTYARYLTEVKRRLKALDDEKGGK